MSDLLTALFLLCGTLILAMGGGFWWMAQQGKSPASSKAFAVLFSVSGALILALQALQWVMPGFPVIEASAS